MRSIWSWHSFIGINFGDRRLPHDELLKVGGEALACRLSDLAQRVVREESWPIEWKGGRIIDLFKHKGSPLVCDSYRGILLASHMMKVVLAQIMKPFQLSNLEAFGSAAPILGRTSFRRSSRPRGSKAGAQGFCT
jgi:hypothetical protein